ncbi:hypothetical protein N431DRAFT_562216 [Stipitochalara longipes BDJ]|nr:hypothetical protein N431DRAFT_562216 [Stipitochalara longipes BDJ]
MDFAQWGPITDGFDLNLLSDTVGYFWNPPADAGSVLENAEYAIENYPIEPTTGPQQTLSDFSSAGSSHSQEYDTPPNNDDLDADDGGTSRSMGRPRFPVQSSRDATMNRIQRRRVQNRNSQRIYRQRRVEERNKFETRAMEAEKTASELRVHLAELHAIVASLRHQVEELRAENATLRRCSRCELLDYDKTQGDCLLYQNFEDTTMTVTKTLSSLLLEQIGHTHCNIFVDKVEFSLRYGLGERPIRGVNRAFGPDLRVSSLQNRENGRKSFVSDIRQSVKGTFHNYIHRMLGMTQVDYGNIDFDAEAQSSS